MLFELVSINATFHTFITDVVPPDFSLALFCIYPSEAGADLLGLFPIPAGSVAIKCL